MSILGIKLYTFINNSENTSFSIFKSTGMNTLSFTPINYRNHSVQMQSLLYIKSKLLYEGSLYFAALETTWRGLEPGIISRLPVLTCPAV